MTDLTQILAVAKIIWIDVLLSGDNALVIAAACLVLPPRQRTLGMVLGAGAAVFLRIVATGFIMVLLGLPFVKMIGGGFLFYVAAGLVHGDEAGEPKQGPGQLLRAIITVVIADASMSIDNVVAIAGAANGHPPYIIFGLLLSIPLVVAGAAVISRILEAAPFLLWIGCALLGWIAGELIGSDPISGGFDPWVAGLCGATVALMMAFLWRQILVFQLAHWD